MVQRNLALTLEKLGIGEDVAIFWTIYDPLKLEGLSHVNPTKTRVQVMARKQLSPVHLSWFGQATSETYVVFLCWGCDILLRPLLEYRDFN